MARRIRRHSMERLKLYDLDQFITISPFNTQSSPPPPPPPLPPPRKHQQRRPSMNPTFERYKFLCNMTRSKTDSIYAATPMFTTIPHSSEEKHPRQLLGSYVRLENVKPLAPKSTKLSEPKSAKIMEEEKENANDRNEDVETDVKKENGGGNDDDDDEKDSDGSSSSDDKQDKDAADVLDDDDGKKGVVEQIFNRDKKD